MSLRRHLGVAFEALESPGPADAEDLQRLRESLGLTQAEAARHVGVDAGGGRRGTTPGPERGCTG